MHLSRGQHAEKCVNKKSLIVFCFSNSQGVAFPWVCCCPCFSWVDKCFFVLHGSIMPLGSEYDEEEVDYEESDSDESWTTESAISSESILSSMSMNGADEKPFACPVPGCKKRYKNVNGIKYHAKNGHRTQIRVRKPFKCRCGKSYKTSQGLRHHTINFHPPVSTEILRKIQG
uniref:JAZF zinc finger 1 n=1 Tax=Neolamprologus brichardi TaxID=32507 RepID=A0A3Q4GA19_NEOBR